MRAFLSSWFLAYGLAWAGSDVDAIRELIKAGRFQEAVARCDAALRASPGQAPLWTLKGLALRAAGDRAGAVTALERAGSYLPALQALAQLRFDARDPMARTTLEALLRASPAATPARAMLATLAFEARDCARVVDVLAPWADPAPGARWQLGVCQYESGRWAQAAAQFTALLRLREHAPTRYNLALAQWQLRDYRAAAATLERAAEPDARRLLATVHQAAGDVPRAVAVLQQAMESFPTDERFVVDLAVLCFDQGNYPLGIEVAEAGARRHPESEQLRVLLGVLQVRGGQLDAGEQTLRAAEKNSPLGRIGVASLLMQMGLAAEAAQMVEADAKASPPDDRAVVTHARALLQAGTATAALAEMLESVTKRDARNAAAQGLLGKALAQLGRPAPAMEALRAAIALDPGDRTSTYQLMMLCRQLGRAKEAGELAQRIKAMRDEPDRPRFQLVRAE